MIRLSLLTTSHRTIFQHRRVRASTQFYPRFTLPMVRSPAFASTAVYLPCGNACFALAFALAPPRKGLTEQTTVTRRIIIQKARGQAGSSRSSTRRPPTACNYLVSDSISLPSKGFFSPFTHATRALSVMSLYLALGGGPPGFTPVFTWLALLGNMLRRPETFRLRDFHPLWPAIPDGSTRLRFVDSLPVRTPTEPSHNPERT